MITYTDTSVLLKLLLDDEAGTDGAQRLWLASDHLVCVEIGYVEARAALAAAHRARRIDDEGLVIAKAELADLWTQIDHVPITAVLLSTAGDTAEFEGLHGYDAVHLTAAIGAEANVMASADEHLLAAAERNRLDTSNPLAPSDNTGSGDG